MAVPALDRGRLDELCGGDAAVEHDLLEILIVESASLLADLRSATSANDVTVARERVHALKGIAANMGALRLEAIAREMEDAVRGDELLGLEPRFAATDAALEELKHLADALAD
ncbi:MAG TPA: Hpt domain-containing protein [Candidatus Acidoferrum sp.]|jgi:HPt (histidine-containing phosphotransfer) domain-containing protein|nr:Hpt domain-containing protein [Candidatus Acidoferrum sp.]